MLPTDSLEISPNPFAFLVVSILDNFRIRQAHLIFANFKIQLAKNDCFL